MSRASFLQRISPSLVVLLLLEVVGLAPGGKGLFEVAHGQTTDCADAFLTPGRVTLRAMATRQMGCTISVSPQESGLIYRRYAFYSNGMFTVFNSFGEGRSRTQTGIRTYFLFPRGRPLAVTSTSESEVVISTASGAQARFSSTSGDLLSLDSASVVLASQITPQQQGGVELSPHSGILLDSGFGVGRPAYVDGRAQSTFQDGVGNRCQVPNSMLFVYGGQDPVFRFADDSSMQQFLRSRCPTLQW
jgi:hypothetical protein